MNKFIHHAIYLAIAVLLLIAGSKFLAMGFHFYGDAIHAILVAVGFSIAAVAITAAILGVVNLLFGIATLGFLIEALLIVPIGYLYFKVLGYFLPAIVHIDSEIGTWSIGAGLALVLGALALIMRDTGFSISANRILPKRK